jgi:hypothetical protein
MMTITQFLGPSNGQSRQFNDANARIEFGCDAISGAVDHEDKKAAAVHEFALARGPATGAHQQITSDLVRLVQCILDKPRGRAPT